MADTNSWLNVCCFLCRHLQKDLAAPMTHITLMNTTHKNMAVSQPWTAADEEVVMTGVVAEEAVVEAA